MPSRKRLGRDPDCEAAPLLECPVVRRPVADLVARRRDLVTARLMDLVGHRSSGERGDGPIHSTVALPKPEAVILHQRHEEGDASQVGPLLDQIPGPLASVIADGAYDGEPVYHAVAERQPDPPVAVVIPPRSTAVPSPVAGSTPSQRDQHIQTIRDKGRLGWQTAVGYGRRSLGETAMFRYKTVIGRGLRARALPAQKTEARVGCAVLNRMESMQNRGVL